MCSHARHARTTGYSTGRGTTFNATAVAFPPTQTAASPRSTRRKGRKGSAHNGTVRYCAATTVRPHACACQQGKAWSGMVQSCWYKAGNARARTQSTRARRRPLDAKPLPALALHAALLLRRRRHSSCCLDAVLMLSRCAKLWRRRWPAQAKGGAGCAVGHWSWVACCCWAAPPTPWSYRA
jgi:hypothetical protein